MSGYFPSEVIAEILRRLPPKSLVKCFCVCKAWKSIITNDAFIISHYQHLQTNPTNSSLFFHLQSYGYAIKAECDFYSLYSDDDATDTLPVFKIPSVYPSVVYACLEVVGTCNGLVCFADYPNSGQAVIWNPIIHKYLILPKPSLILTQRAGNLAFYGFGFDSRNHDFRVARFVSYPEISSQVEIYSLAAHSWRTITVAPLPFRIAVCTNKFVNGVLHWLAYRIINGMNHYSILTFDIVEEKFGELMVPQSLSSLAEGELSILTGGNLLALKNSYCDVCSSECCTVWVMKEYGVIESWTKLFHFDSTTYDYILRVLAIRNNEEVVIESLDHEITFLDPTKAASVKKIDNRFAARILFVGEHVESLFLMNEINAETYLPDTYLSL